MCDTLAMMCTFSAPTWFLTLSPAGYYGQKLYKPLELHMAKHSQKGCAENGLENKSKYLWTNQVTIFLMFQHGL